MAPAQALGRRRKRQRRCKDRDPDEQQATKNYEMPVSAFPASECASDVELDTHEMVRAQNKKKKKSGGFQSMGLSYPIFKGIMKKGYKIPTPIQRKTIPVILDGKDVVAMARTGSGKTACFLIPMFEKLKAHSAKTGARALILSPTRELALQTLKFAKELGRFAGLQTALILGGDKMEDQFAALHENPDIIIATPGRLVHVAVEMKLKLQSVEYVVFDEADRLFEMGFAEQLKEILSRLPENRQTVLFSATLPKLLVEFARAGLTEPVLVRLDVESKLSEQLKLSFFHVRADDKPALLLHLLRTVVKPQEQTIVFVATKHHTEYLKELLTSQGVNCTHVYSSLDQTARKINIGKFTHGKCSVLLVTDLAARGIDIPLLDNVINYSFPAKSKLFLHRVGRVARAGRSGTAYSLVAPDETPYIFDLHLFLGRPLVLASPHEKPADTDGMFGRVPQSVIDDEESMLQTDHERSLELQNLRRVADNAQKQYQKSRPGPSPESIKRVKEMDFSLVGIHPLFSLRFEDDEMERLKFVDSIKTYRSKATIFEINATNKTLASDVMRAKRSRDRLLIDRHQRKQQERLSVAAAAAAAKAQGPAAPAATEEQAAEAEEHIQDVFSSVVGRKRKRHEAGESTRKKSSWSEHQDKEFYVPYRPKDFDSERGLCVGGEGSAFEQQASSAVLDLMGDENQNMNKNKQRLKWDRKRKRFVEQTGQQEKRKKIRTESGVLISSSYRGDLYEKWKKKTKIDEQDSEAEAEGERRGGKPRKGRGAHRAPSQGSRGPQPGRSELKTKQQILKTRRKVAKQRFLQSGGLKRLKSRNRQRVQELRRSAFGRGSTKKGKLRKRM
ncbi:ATP-dependent RNA helicase DDX54 [Varanus komodoensis]|uniref:ATP-dependent RNA helicase DDX54 n=2 Tax=Varanus komodoensis TaxID=61221 RepID=A0A8D2J1S6_VARKO|nr:ATP-dependent RNA helicase DDX54 [Varanus komodoensis]